MQYRSLRQHCRVRETALCGRAETANSIAGDDARHFVADGENSTGNLGARDDRWLRVGRVLAAADRNVEEVQADCLDGHQYSVGRDRTECQLAAFEYLDRLPESPYVPGLHRGRERTHRSKVPRQP
jgi:hypothetical protein